MEMDAVFIQKSDSYAETEMSGICWQLTKKKHKEIKHGPHENVASKAIVPSISWDTNLLSPSQEALVKHTYFPPRKIN